MALQIELPDNKSNTGVGSITAYCRIDKLEFDTRTGGEVKVAVNIYANLACRTDNKSPIAGNWYSGKTGVDMPSIDDNLPGIRAVLYGWLKTLPDFTGAIDV